MDDMAARVAAGSLTVVEGTWQRHVPSRFSTQALEGRTTYGRWGTRDGFPVLYLAQPRESAIVEAYRHLVDPVEASEVASTIRSRMLVTCKVRVSDVLDLRKAATRVSVGLTMNELQSDTGDRESYAACQLVAQVAHQLGHRGVIAPAATGLGETLALFTDRLAEKDKPIRDTEDEVWERLPADPRTASRLRVVGAGD